MWSGSPRRRLYYIGLHVRYCMIPMMHGPWSMLYGNSMYNEMLYGRGSRICCNSAAAHYSRIPYS